MIEWMKTLPPDVVVKCGFEESYGYGHFMAIGPVNIDCCDVFEYITPEWNNSPHVGKHLVIIWAK